MQLSVQGSPCCEFSWKLFVWRKKDDIRPSLSHAYQFPICIMTLGRQGGVVDSRLALLEENPVQAECARVSDDSHHRAFRQHNQTADALEFEFVPIFDVRVKFWDRGMLKLVDRDGKAQDMPGQPAEQNRAGQGDKNQKIRNGFGQFKILHPVFLYHYYGTFLKFINVFSRKRQGLLKVLSDDFTTHRFIHFHRKER